MQNVLKLLKFALKCHQTASVFLRDINSLQLSGQSRLTGLFVQNLEILLLCFQFFYDRVDNCYTQFVDRRKSTASYDTYLQGNI